MEEIPLPTLHPDSLIQIFHKLPIRSLLQSKLVCKEWCSLISVPFFKSNYNPTSIPNHPINLMMIPIPNPARFNSPLGYEIDGSDNRLVPHHQPLPGYCPFRNPNFTFLGSWNGLVALYHSHGDFILLNPCSGEEKTVHVKLNDDTIRVNYQYGLGYDSSNHEYKAILAALAVHDWDQTIDLYIVSFKQGEWKVKRRSRFDMEYYVWPSNKTGIVVNGVPHWIVSSSDHKQLFFFDQREEEFRDMPQPKEWDEKVLCGIGALDGKLTVAVSKNNCYMENLGGFEVWVLRDFVDSESWSSLFFIANKLRYVSPLWSMNDEEVLMDVNREELMIYNHMSRILRKLQSRMKRKVYEIITYYPSFVSPTVIESDPRH